MFANHHDREESRVNQSRAHAMRLRLFHRIAQSPLIFHYVRLPAYWGTMDRLARAVDLRQQERLLDVGCGSGVGAKLTVGMYVGIDTDVDLLRFARSVVKQAHTSFAVMSALDVGFTSGAFDKAVLINMVHHLPDDVLDRLLQQLTLVVRTKVVVLDVDRAIANPVSGFFLDHDRGHYVRKREALRSALARHWEIEAEEEFHNLMRTVPQLMFTLVPKARGATPAGAPDT
jgi:SAM-dependent methyltransferase